MSAVQDGNECRVANTSLARHVEITATESHCLHVILVLWNLFRSRMVTDFLEKSLKVLQVARSCMETQDAHELENILVVGQVCHCLDKTCPMSVQVCTSKYVYILVCTLVCTNIYRWRLAPVVVRVASHHSLADLVKNAVSLFKTPFGLLTSLVWQVFLHKIKEINSLLLQLRQL